MLKPISQTIFYFIYMLWMIYSDSTKQYTSNIEYVFIYIFKVVGLQELFNRFFYRFLPYLQSNVIQNIWWF